MIDPGHGFAPQEWQSAVGDCLVVRQDKKPLDIQTLAAITDYVSDILDSFGAEMSGTAVARRYYTKEKFDEFMDDHLQMQQSYKSMSGS